MNRPLSILIVNNELPQHDRKSGALRLFELVRLLVDEGHTVTFVARHGLGQEAYALELEALGVDVRRCDPDRAVAAGQPVPASTPAIDLPALLAEGRFDLAVLSFYDVAEQYLPIIRRDSPSTRIAIDTVDVHSVRELRGAQLSGDPAHRAAAERTRAREAAVYGAADALVAVADDDAAALGELAPGVPVHVVGNVHQPEPDGPSFAQRSGVVFVGNFVHAPNVDAIVWFCRDVWPAVRLAVPGIDLHVVGQHPTPEVQSVAAEDIVVTGWVPETRPFLDAARVSVAPLRYGAGIKGKIGEAMAHGLPVVTTTVGAEGMGLGDGVDVRVADDPAGFAQAIAELHGDEVLWRTIAASGRERIAATLSPDVARVALRALLDAAVPRLFVAAAPDADVLDRYVRAHPPDAPVSLLLPAPADPAAQAALFQRVAGDLQARGHDLEAIPDIAIVDAAVPIPAAAQDLAAPAAARARRARPRTAVLVRLPDDDAAAGRQLEALAAAGWPDDVAVVLAASGRSPARDALLARASGATLLRDDAPIGRRSAIARATGRVRPDTLVVVDPLVHPAPGFLAPLVDALDAGAALAGPMVDAAHGLALAGDGSLWPLAADAPATPDALPFDLLAARRELWEALPDALPAREGHAETQLGAFCAEHGALAVAPAASARRDGGPPASVIIATRNRVEELRDGVELLVASGLERHGSEVVIVDNGSTDGTAELAAELAAEHPGLVRWVTEPNAGLCHARNAGAAAARHELLLYVDDDARAAPGWLERMTHGLALDGVVNAGGPICALWPPEREAAWPEGDLEKFLSVLSRPDADALLVPPAVVYGANWAVRRSALRSVGMFDPEFGPGPGVAINGDETSVARRLHRAGLGTTRFVAGAAVGHRIPAARVSDAFLVERAATSGVEQVRLDAALDGIDQARLMHRAQAAAHRLNALAPLTGGLDAEVALTAIADAPLSAIHRTWAASALGELTASVLLLGQNRVAVGDLVVDTDVRHLGGLRCSVRV